MTLNTPEKNFLNIYNDELILRNYLHKLNYSMILNSSLCNIIDLNLLFNGKHHSYTIQESVLINNIYNKNLFQKIDDYIQYNNNKIVNISNKYIKDDVQLNIDPSTFMDPLIMDPDKIKYNTRTYITNSLWQNLKNIKLTDIINDDTLNIRFYTSDTEYDFNNVIQITSIITFLEDIATKIVDRLNLQFKWIDFNIDEFLSNPPPPLFIPPPAVPKSKPVILPPVSVDPVVAPVVTKTPSIPAAAKVAPVVTKTPSVSLAAAPAVKVVAVAKVPVPVPISVLNPIIALPAPTISPSGIIPDILKQKIKDIANSEIDYLINTYKMHPSFVDPKKKEFIINIKDKINTKITQKLIKNDKEFYDLNGKNDITIKNKVCEYLLQELNDIDYPETLISLLSVKDNFDLQTKLLLYNVDFNQTNNMILNYINDQFYIILTTNYYTSKPNGYDQTTLDTGIITDKRKIYKKYRLMKESIFKKYNNKLIELKKHKNIKEAITNDITELITEFDNISFKDYSFKDLNVHICNKNYNDYLTKFFNLFDIAQQELLKAYLIKLKGISTLTGGYNSINHSLEKINKILLRINNNHIFQYNIFSEITGTYVTNTDKEIDYRLPLHVQIFYTIYDIKTAINKKIVLMNLYYERKDIALKTDINRHFFFNRNNSFLNDRFNISYDKKLSLIQNVISIQDTINNLEDVIRQKYLTKRKKMLLQLIFILNLFNSNVTLFNKLIIDKLNKSLHKFGDIDRIIQRLKEIFTTQNNADLFFRYLSGLHFDIKSSYDTTTKNISITKINLGITEPTTLYTNYKKITQTDIINYLANFNDIVDKSLKNNLKNITEMIVLQPPTPTFFNFTDTVQNINIAFYNYNKNVIAQDMDINYTTSHTLYKVNSILENHTTYITNKSRLPFLNTVKEYTNTNKYSQKINNLIYRTFTTNDVMAQDIFNKKFILTDEYKNILYDTLNLYQAIMKLDNSINPSDYLILSSHQDTIFGSNDKSIISNYKIGDEFFISYFISASINLNNTFPERSYGYNLIIIVPTTEKYLTVFGRYYDKKLGVEVNVSSIPSEEEIILPPGYYKVLSITNKYAEFYEIVVIYESMKLDTSSNLINRQYEPKLSYDDELKYLKSIREQMKKRDTIFSVKSITPPVNLKLLNFQQEAYPYIDPKKATNPTITRFNSLSQFKVPTDKANLDKYRLSNLSPLYNIFNLESKHKHTNAGKQEGIYFNIYYETLLYTGQEFPPTNFAMQKYKKIYMSHFMIANAYGISHQFAVRNTYTLRLDGTIHNINLIDNFHPSNVAKIKAYHDSLPPGHFHKDALNAYYKFTVVYDTKCDINSQFVWNKEPVRIKYNNLHFSGQQGDYSKRSVSTENDSYVIEALKEIFGEHDGYISRSQFALCHFNGVFDDEIVIYDIIKLKSNNQFEVIIDIPTTIITDSTIPKNILTYLNNPVTPYQKLNVYIAENMYTIRKILEKTKLVREWETLKYAFMFDKYVDYSYHPYEKYFRNIYNAMNIYITTPLPPPITSLPLLGGKNNNKIYKQKYRKYKQKYLELKKINN
jgi:hypothetical protein